MGVIGKSADEPGEGRTAVRSQLKFLAERLRRLVQAKVDRALSCYWLADVIGVAEEHRGLVVDIPGRARQRRDIEALPGFHCDADLGLLGKLVTSFVGSLLPEFAGANASHRTAIDLPS